MLTPSRLTAAALLVVFGAFVASAAEPELLVKAVNPRADHARIRLLMTGKTATSSYKAQIPPPKGKGVAPAEITVYANSLSSTPSVSIQQWKAWGFEVPADRAGVLPELIIPAAQVAPKLAKGRDVEFRLTNIKVRLYEAAGGEKGGVNNYLSLSVDHLTGGDTRNEPRVYFADRFIELSAPVGAIKKLDAGAKASPDPQITIDETLRAAFIPTTGTRIKFASVNGQISYTPATGKVESVAAGLVLGGGAIVMSVSMARGCGVDLDKEMSPTSGKVKELRFGPITGPGVKGQKDFVLKDVKVAISNNEDGSFISLGSAFVEEYFQDGVFECGSNGEWRLHGRVKPEHIDDVKNRAPAKKP